MRRELTRGIGPAIVLLAIRTIARAKIRPSSAPVSMMPKVILLLYKTITEARVASRVSRQQLRYAGFMS